MTDPGRRHRRRTTDELFLLLVEVDQSHHWGAVRALSHPPARRRLGGDEGARGERPPGDRRQGSAPRSSRRRQGRHDDELDDAWFAGYVPSLTTATWVGYPLHPRSMSDVHGIQVQGGSFPAEIWRGYTGRALAGTPHGRFHGGGWLLRPYRGPRSMRHHG